MNCPWSPTLGLWNRIVLFWYRDPPPGPHWWFIIRTNFIRTSLDIETQTPVWIPRWILIAIIRIHIPRHPPPVLIARSQCILDSYQVSWLSRRQISVCSSIVVEVESDSAEKEGGHGEKGSGWKRNRKSESVKRNSSSANITTGFSVLRIGFFATAETKIM